MGKKFLNKTEVRVIDLVNQKCKQIIKEKYADDRFPFRPYFIISEMYGKGYVLTLIVRKKEGFYEYRQSEFITLNTDLDKTIELLYNRTT